MWKDIVLKAKESGMSTVALTDFGNMYGAFEFVSEALKHEVKPIVGCEFFRFVHAQNNGIQKDNPDKRFTQILMAKTKVGYHNLAPNWVRSVLPKAYTESIRASTKNSSNNIKKVSSPPRVD